MKMPGFENGYIASVTFGFDLKRDDYYRDDVIRSLEILKEETNANDLITKMELFGSDPKSLYMLNSELKARVYAAPSLVL